MASKPVMLITGTRQGIGRHLSSHYSANGYEVIGCSRGETDFVHENYHHFCLDISDESQLKGMFNYIKKTFGRLDVLVNNAGIYSVQHIMLLTADEIKNVYNVNVIGNMLNTREAVKIMKKGRFGRIINFSSFAVPLAVVGTSVYSSSKSSIEQFSKVLKKEVASFNITVNSIAFSCVRDSGMVEALSEQTIEYLDKNTSLDLFINMEDVIYCLDFFISDRARFLTGQTLYTSGV